MAATPYTLETDLIVSHVRLIQALEKKYFDHINALLKQKNVILDALQKQFIERRNDIHKRASNENMNETSITIENVQQPLNDLDETESEHDDPLPAVFHIRKRHNDQKNGANDQSDSKKYLSDRNNLLKTKLKKQQKNEKRFKCDQCEYSTNNKSHYTRHCRVHSGERPFKCVYKGCNKSFKRKYHLKTHMKYHLGQKDHKCPYCHKEFFEICHLKAHIRIHTGEKTFVCAFGGCKKRFSQKGNLNEHMKRHIGDKRHKCSYCYKAFVTGGELRNHVRIHTGVKPYECKHCNEKFADQSNMRKHIKSKHK